MSEEDKKKLKEYPKNYRETKKHASQMQTCVTNIHFFRSFINFKRIKWCVNNNKSLMYGQMGRT